MGDEIPVHYASYIPFDRWKKPPSDTARAIAACGKPYAVLRKGVLWLEAFITDDSRLVTCQACRDSETEEWAGIHRAPQVRGSRPWRLEGSCVLSNDDEIVAIVPPNMADHAPTLANARRMLDLVAQLAANNTVDAREQAVAILADIRQARERAAVPRRRTTSDE
jgi:hypothetical protein